MSTTFTTFTTLTTFFFYSLAKDALNERVQRRRIISWNKKNQPGRLGVCFDFRNELFPWLFQIYFGSTSIAEWVLFEVSKLCSAISVKTSQCAIRLRAIRLWLTSVLREPSSQETYIKELFCCPVFTLTLPNFGNLLYINCNYMYKSNTLKSLLYSNCLVLLLANCVMLLE